MTKREINTVTMLKWECIIRSSKDCWNKYHSYSNVLSDGWFNQPPENEQRRFVSKNIEDYYDLFEKTKSLTKATINI